MKRRSGGERAEDKNYEPSAVFCKVGSSGWSDCNDNFGSLPVMYTVAPASPNCSAIPRPIPAIVKRVDISWQQCGIKRDASTSSINFVDSKLRRAKHAALSSLERCRAVIWRCCTMQYLLIRSSLGRSRCLLSTRLSHMLQIVHQLDLYSQIPSFVDNYTTPCHRTSMWSYLLNTRKEIKDG